MSQTTRSAKGTRRGSRPVGRTAVPVQAAPGAPQGATLAVPDVASLGSRFAGWFAGSPGRLRIAAGLSALACLAFAAVGGLSMQYRANALEDARSHANQVLRVQKATADLVRADAAVANGFLRGGSEPTSLVAEYDDAVARASRLLVDAAAAEPGDRVRLAQANQLLADYSRQVASARAANRQGQPLGSGYLVVASQTVLRGQLLPLLDATVEANSSEVDAAFARAGNASFLFFGGVVPALVVVGGVQVWLARRTHRIVNVGLAAATAALLVGTVVAVGALSSSSGVVKDVQDASYKATRELGNARAAAYSAKGLESLTLVKQGGGAAYEAQWKERAVDVDAALRAAGAAGVQDGPLSAAFAQWKDTHETIRGLDDGGRWQEAVAIAIGTGAASSNADFAVFVDALDPLLDAQAARVSDRLGQPWSGLQTAGWAAVALGVLALVASVAGLSRRLEEYR